MNIQCPNSFFFLKLEKSVVKTTILSADLPSLTGGLRIFKFIFMGRFVSPVGATFQYAHTMDASTHCLVIWIKFMFTALVHRRPTHYIAATPSRTSCMKKVPKDIQCILHSSILLLCTFLHSP